MPGLIILNLSNTETQMKKIILIATAIIMLASFKSQAQSIQKNQINNNVSPESTQVIPPLKLVESIDTVGWSPYSIPDYFADSMNDDELTQAESKDRRSEIAAEIADFAAQFIGRRYRLGATGPKSFDCSGLIAYIFKKAGIELNRTSKMQYAQGSEVPKEDLKPGDLMFFSSPRSGRGRVGHVAMVVDVDQDSGKCTFIHASTSKGVSYQIFPDGGYFSRNYIGAKRVIA